MKLKKVLIQEEKTMKKWTSKLKTEAQKFWNDEEAQGMMEYILIAVAVIGAVVIFKGKIQEMIGNKTDQLNSEVMDFSSQ